MGVPKFYRFISERYPLINIKIEHNNVPDMDNLYLDMNGIVHNCVRSTSEGAQRYQNTLQENRTNEDIFLDVFKYIDNLFALIRPRKVVYFAIDGVAPRAKMNQQRSRRFRSAKERTDEHNKKIAEDPLYVAAKSTPFDSNCISPGTEFMAQLTDALQYFVSERVSNNPQWADLDVVVSGAEAYGEGEHKIMEYIRAVKVGGKMPPNTRHCLYGLDADLIMLALLSHEPHFFLLREKIDFSAYWKKKGGPRTVSHLDTITFGQFELLSIGILREYLALDVGAGGNAALPFFDVERIVDDFVVMLMLVGNDFLPHLPTVEIADGIVVAMMHLYRRLLPRMGGYLSESGRICPDRVELFVAKLSLFEPRSMKRKDKEERTKGHKFGQKRLFQTAEDLDNIFGFSETTGMGEPPYNYNIKEGIFKCREITETVDHAERKRKYYSKKFGASFDADQESFTHNLCTSYMHGVMWTLKYYFEGCQSWRWFYPEHYAPFPSDLTSIAERVEPSSLSFSPDKPYLPLQQLMSVLPPASSDCIPAPYRKLMTSAASPIRDFYPEDFKMDMNGKRNEWEAVVLLPFIDSKRLFEAMASISQADLTEAEKKRNTLGDSIVYRKDENGFSAEIISPFPQRLRGFVSCAKGTPLSLPTIPRGAAFPPEWVVGTHAAGSASWVSDMPSLFPVPHTGRLEKVDINLFGFPSRNESLAVTLGSWVPTSRDFIFFDGVEDPQAENSSLSVAPTTIGSTALPQNSYKIPNTVQEAHALGIAVGGPVWTHFPWRVPGMVEAVKDENLCVRLSPAAIIGNAPLVSKTNKSNFNNSVKTLAASLMEKGGVDISPPKVLVEVRPIASEKNSVLGNSNLESAALVFPIVTVLSAEAACKEPVMSISTSVPRPVFSVNQTALFVGRGPFFGTLCNILHVADKKANVRFPVLEKGAREPPFGYDIVEKWQSQRWKSLSQIASRCRMAVQVTNAFLGSIRVRLEKGKDEIDLGLGVKYSSRNLYIPGYAKPNDYGGYFFSEKAISLLSEYKEAFPQLFDVILRLMSGPRSKGAPVYEPRTLFPSASNSEAAVMSIASWISTKELASLPLVPSGSFVLPRDAVLELERGVSTAKKVQGDLLTSLSNGSVIEETRSVSVNCLRSGSETLAWQDEAIAERSQCFDPVSPDGRGIRLGDRVANRLAYTGTPFGLRGSVIGVHGGVHAIESSSAKASNRRQRTQGPEEVKVSRTCTVEVVFDEQFIGGGDLNGLCSPGKGKAVPATSLYAIRPDRENRFYASHLSRLRLSSTVAAASSRMSKDNPAQRSKAIAAAAIKKYRKAVEPIARKQNMSVNGAKNVIPSIPQAVPIQQVASHVSEPRTGRSIGYTVSQTTSPEAIADEAAILTAKLKMALGIGPAPSDINAGMDPPVGVAIAPLSQVGASSSSAPRHSSPNGSSSRRKPRHRNRRHNGKGVAGQNPIASKEPGTNPGASSEFSSVWNQLLNRSSSQ